MNRVWRISSLSCNVKKQKELCSIKVTHWKTRFETCLQIPYTSGVIIQDALPVKRHQRDTCELAFKGRDLFQSPHQLLHQNGKLESRSDSADLRQTVGFGHYAIFFSSNSSLSKQQKEKEQSDMISHSSLYFIFPWDKKEWI